MKFKFQPITDPHEQETKELTPDYADILKERIADFEATLAHGLDSFETLDLSQAAKDFRKLATDLKLTELLITKRGKLNPKNVLNDLTGKEWLQHTKSLGYCRWQIQGYHRRNKGSSCQFSARISGIFYFLLYTKKWLGVRSLYGNWEYGSSMF